MSVAKPFNLVVKELRIPFVAAWELETPTVQWDQSVMANAVYTGVVDHRAAAAAGELGKVILGEMAPQRQRYVMTHQLCQVCGKQLDSKVLLGHPAEHGPEKLLAFDEPAACPECALVAIQLCPYARKGWGERGGILADQVQLYIQMAEMRKGDDRAALFGKNTDAQMPRATFRRWMGKPLAVHVRLVPVTGARIEGAEGLAILEALADRER